MRVILPLSFVKNLYKEGLSYLFSGTCGERHFAAVFMGVAFVRRDSRIFCQVPAVSVILPQSSWE